TTVANWRRVKGIDILVKAAGLVCKEFPNARFLLIGTLSSDGDERAFTEEVLRVKEAQGTSRNVIPVGASDHVPEFLSLSDVYVSPSRSEGLSNSLLEAMRAGLPCVATNVGGNPEVVVDKLTGYLVPTEDPEALADRILELLRYADLRRSMGAA